VEFFLAHVHPDGTEHVRQLFRRTVIQSEGFEHRLLMLGGEFVFTTPSAI
jgi:hypothetical protein